MHERIVVWHRDIIYIGNSSVGNNIYTAERSNVLEIQIRFLQMMFWIKHGNIYLLDCNSWEVKTKIYIQVQVDKPHIMMSWYSCLICFEKIPNALDCTKHDVIEMFIFALICEWFYAYPPALIVIFFILYV
jgi:hypothetical protein